MSTNFLSALEFDFTIKRLPNVSFQVQSVTLPGLSLGVTEQPTPFKNIPLHGDKLTYDELTLSIKLDEDMQAWEEIYDWMIGIGKPDDYTQHASLVASDDGIYSDASLIVISNNRIPNREFTFKNMFPVSLAPITLDTRSPNVEYVVLDIGFKYQSYSIKKT